MKFSPETVSRSPIFRPREHALLHIALHGHEGRICHGNPPIDWQPERLIKPTLPIRCLRPPNEVLPKGQPRMRSSYWGWEKPNDSKLRGAELKGSLRRVAERP